jgi:Zn-dependent peptidase ImmA (M78 family)
MSLQGGRMKRGVPDPEVTAFELVIKAGQTRPPVEFTSILGLWPGLRVSYDWLDKEGYLIDLGAQGGEIIVRADNLEPRRRYTIAHELGHWVLQKLGLPKTVDRDPEIEKWCDRFGASLLMPAEWVVSDLRRAKLKGLATNVATSHKRYNVSPEAFRLRVSEIAPVTVFEAALDKRSVLVKRRYETDRLPRQQVNETFARASSHLLPRRHAGWMYVDQETSLVALSTLVRSPDLWIVCVLPRSRQAKAS